jgi:GxxExxY protein
MEVHSALGPGLLESAYEACLCHELVAAGLKVQRQVQVPVQYKDFTVDCGFRLDLLVGDSVVVEVKSIERVHPIHETQLFTYLKVSGHRLGLLLNFNVSHMRNGITRRIL